MEGEKKVDTKGVKRPVTIDDFVGIGGEYNIFLKQQEEEFFPLAEAIPIQYAILDGKHVSAVMLKGNLVKISAKGAEVRSPSSVVALSNIKFNLLTQNTPDSASEDIYAKVIEKKTDNGNFCIHFTSIPPNIEAMLNELYESTSSHH